MAKKYYLRTERMRVVERGDRGQVTSRTRLVRGDRVDNVVSEERLAELVESGAVTTEKPGAQPEPESTQGGQDEATSGQGDGPAGENPSPDVYDDMDYATLQSTAKGRGINAGGSADEIRQRLREDDGNS